jgi:hypothetical protein
MSTPKFAATAEQRTFVSIMSAAGVEDHNIASAIINPLTGKPITETTLKKFFRHELHKGRALANARVIAALYKSALSGNLGAQCFWLRNCAGWKNADRTEVVGHVAHAHDHAFRIEFVRSDGRLVHDLDEDERREPLDPLGNIIDLKKLRNG